MPEMTPHQKILDKIIPEKAIGMVVQQWKDHGEKVVFTNGCFDLLHRGHIDYLSKAAALGTKLVIGLNSDSSVRRLKGIYRPFQDEQTRSMILASLLFTDAIVLFQSDTPYDLIRTVQPDILVKGNDYSPEEIVGYDIVTSYGGEVKTLEYIKGHSTTLLTEKIKNSR
jgi:rfaE bifunctional protein nucleotidyltransferase chain/domain